MYARRALVGLLAAASLAGAAAPALAHTELVSTSPKKGAVVKHLPATIKMNFTEAPQRVVSGRLLVAPVEDEPRQDAPVSTPRTPARCS